MISYERVLIVSHKALVGDVMYCLYGGDMRGCIDIRE